LYIAEFFITELVCLLQEVSFLLPALLGLLLDCATRPDQTLAAISMGALVRLAEVGGHQFNDKDWSTVLDSIRYFPQLCGLSDQTRGNRVIL
jgi:hypothetical protein